MSSISSLSHLGTSQLVTRELDFGKVAFTKGLDHVVVANVC